MKKLFMTFFLFFFAFTLAQAQYVNIPITVTDNDGSSTTINFGIDPTATDGIDAALGEVSLPPNPPAGTFEARFLNAGGSNLGFGSYKDYRLGNNTSIMYGKQYQFQAQKTSGATTTSFVFGAFPAGVTGSFKLATSVNYEPIVPGQTYTYGGPSFIVDVKIDYIMTTPQAVVLNAPANNSTNLSQPLTLNWFSSLGAAKYYIYVDGSLKDSTTGGLLDTSKVLNGLTAGAHTWYVVANNVHGNGVASPTWNFSLGEPPTGLLLTAPANNLTDVVLTPTFTYTPATGTAPITHTLTVFKNGVPVSPTPIAVVGGSYTWPVALEQGQAYTWSITATNALGTITAGPWAFTTGSVPTGLVLTAPANNATGVVLAPTFTYTPATGTTPITHTLTLLQNGNPVGAPVVVTGGTYTWPNNLLENTTYTWSITASSAIGSMTAGPWSFTTGTIPNGLALTTPQNNATGVVLNPTFTYTPANGTAPITHTLTLFQNGSPVGAPVVVTGGSYNWPNNLTANTVYTWSITASNAVGSMTAGPWTFTTGTVPAGLALTAPADNATGVVLTPTFTYTPATGTGPITHTLTLLQNGNPVGAPVVVNGGTYTWPNNLLENTTYTWSITASSTIGSMTAGPWSFTTGTIPTGLVLTAPANNATGVVLTPTFTWTEATGTAPITHTLRLFQGGVPVAAPIVVSGGTYTWPTNLLENTVYTWEVQASSIMGTVIAGTWTFTTGTIPAGLALTAPVNNATGVVLNPTLTWTEATGTLPITHTLTLLQNGNPVGAPVVVAGGSYTWPTNLLENTVYTWSVTASSAIGTLTAGPWTFTTGTIPTGLVLTAPVNNATGVVLTPTLTWTEATGTLPITHTLTLLQNGNPVGAPVVVAGGSYTWPNNLLENTVYTWSVTATSAIGTLTAGPWTFTTGTIPTGLVLTAPLDNATGVVVTPTLTWTEATGTLPITHTLTLLQNGNPVGAPVVVAGGSYTWPTNLLQNTTYTWSVTASSALGSMTAGPWAFTTGSVPLAPVLISPANGAVSIPTNPTLTWNALANSDYFSVQVFDPALGQFVLNTTNVVATSQALNGLTTGKTYMWRVRGHNSFGTGPWSAQWNFTVGSALPAPVLVTPVNDSTVAAINVELIWNPVVGANKYEIQVDESPNFIFPLNLTTIQAGTNITFTGEQGKAYYWRVKAIDDVVLNVSSPFSAHRKFTLGSIPNVPTLVAPANNSVNNATNVTFQWNTVPFANSYTLQYWLKDAVDTVTVTNLNDTTTLVNNMAQNSTYYWRVSATNTFGTSAYSVIWNFTTMWNVQPTWTGNLIIQELGANADSVGITFGLHSLATNNLDLNLGEYQLGAMPAVGTMNARFLLPDTSKKSYKDFRDSSVVSAIWHYKFQPGAKGYPVVIKWNIENFSDGSLFMRDPTNLEGVGNIDMRSVSQFTLTDTTVKLLEIYYSKEICVGLQLKQGFQLVSVPVVPASMKYKSVFTNDAASLFFWAPNLNQYYQFSEDSNMVNSKGYWLNMNVAKLVNVCGLKVGDTTRIPIKQGWNLIGVYERPIQTNKLIPTPANLLTSGAYYEWMEAGIGYGQSLTLKQGYGYWIQANVDGYLTINTTLVDPLVEHIAFAELLKSKGNWGKVNVETSEGLRTLYVDTDGSSDNRFDLPPVPPSQLLDARFGSERFVENLDAPRTIKINSTEYPVRINVEGVDVSVKDTKGGKIINTSVRSGGYILISDPSVKEILISKYEVPTEFEMSQNYPNPFNPSTTIKFGIPVDSKVTVKVYDMVGQEVTQLISDNFVAGYHQVEFNANKLSSGVYFYRIDAKGLNGKDYSSVKKMMLLK